MKVFIYMPLGMRRWRSSCGCKLAWNVPLARGFWMVGANNVKTDMSEGGGWSTVDGPARVSAGGVGVMLACGSQRG